MCKNGNNPTAGRDPLEEFRAAMAALQKFAEGVRIATDSVSSAAETVADAMDALDDDAVLADTRIEAAEQRAREIERDYIELSLKNRDTHQRLRDEIARAEKAEGERDLLQRRLDKMDTVALGLTVDLVTARDQLDASRASLERFKESLHAED